MLPLHGRKELYPGAQATIETFTTEFSSEYGHLFAVSDDLMTVHGIPPPPKNEHWEVKHYVFRKREAKEWMGPLTGLPVYISQRIAAYASPRDT